MFSVKEGIGMELFLLKGTCPKVKLVMGKKGQIPNVKKKVCGRGTLRKESCVRSSWIRLEWVELSKWVLISKISWCKIRIWFSLCACYKDKVSWVFNLLLIKRWWKVFLSLWVLCLKGRDFVFYQNNFLCFMLNAESFLL